VAWRSSIAKRGKSRIPLLGRSIRTLGTLAQVSCKELVARLEKEAL